MPGEEAGTRPGPQRAASQNFQLQAYSPQQTLLWKTSVHCKSGPLEKYVRALEKRANQENLVLTFHTGLCFVPFQQ